MDTYPKKQAVKVAAPRKNKFNLGYDHYSTSDFFQPNILCCQEIVPGDSINLKVESFTRTAPLAVPTFGQAKLHTSAFFVPSRIIQSVWNEFITGTVDRHHTEYGEISYLTGQDIILFFTVRGLTKLVVNASDPDVSDIVFKTISGSSIHVNAYNFTPLGKLYYKLLQSLGYRWSWNNGTNNTTHLSALPLLAYAKVFMDWYYPSQYYDVTLLNEYFDTPKHLAATDLDNILSICSVLNYDKDIFNQSWQNPIGPNEHIGSDYLSPSIPDVTVNRSFENPHEEFYQSQVRNINEMDDSAYNTPILMQNSGNDIIHESASAVVISNFGLKALKAATDFMVRNKVSGFRAYERMLLQYGVRLSDDEAKISYFLGKDEHPLQISDVVSTSDTSGAVLGDQAGKGIAYNSGQNWKLDEVKEFGYLIIVQSIIPHVGYPDGLHKSLLHTHPLDFYRGEFDSLGVQALSVGEVFYRARSEEGGDEDPNVYDKVFGFVPRFAEYKYNNDVLVGDFILRTLNTGLDSYHFMRNLNTQYLKNQLNTGYNFIHANDNLQYDRIFNFTGTNENRPDHFYCINHVYIDAYRNMKSLVDNLDLEGDREETIPVNGTQIN